jgi:hypothetical protein
MLWPLTYAVVSNVLPKTHFFGHFTLNVNEFIKAETYFVLEPLRILFWSPCVFSSMTLMCHHLWMSPEQMNVSSWYFWASQKNASQASKGAWGGRQGSLSVTWAYFAFWITDFESKKKSSIITDRKRRH